MYSIVASIENHDNHEVLYTTSDIKLAKHVMELIQSITEWGYYDEMTAPKPVIALMETLAELGVGWEQDGYLPEIESLKLYGITEEL